MSKREPEWDEESFGAWEIFRRLFGGKEGEFIQRDAVYRKERKGGKSHQDAFLKARQTPKKDLPKEK